MVDIPQVLLDRKLGHEYDDQDRRELIAIIDSHKTALRKAAAEIEQLQERMQKAHNHLINLQPHIPQACYPGHESFIDSHIDEAMKLLSETTKNTDRFGVSEAADALGDKLIREARGEVKTRPLTEKDSE